MRLKSEIDVSVQPAGVEIMAPPGMEEMSQQLQGMFSESEWGAIKAAAHEDR